MRFYTEETPDSKRYILTDDTDDNIAITVLICKGDVSSFMNIHMKENKFGYHMDSGPCDVLKGGECYCDGRTLGTKDPEMVFTAMVAEYHHWNVK